MHSFLSTITLGEFVAATDCDIAIRFFKEKSFNHLADAYLSVKRDELNHFNMLRKCIKRIEGVPSFAKEMFRGKNLSKAELGPIEPICLMHSVFEPAAFSYLSELHKRQDITDGYTGLHRAIGVIIADEANHMSLGLKALCPIISSLTLDHQNELKNSIARHIEMLADVPQKTIDDDVLISKIVRKFKTNAISISSRIFS